MNHEDSMSLSSTKKEFEPLKQRENRPGKQIVDIAINLHKSFGPGLLESVYEKCFTYELIKRNIPAIEQHPLQKVYDNLVINDGLRIDLLVDDLVIIEMKAQENYPVWEAQLLSYLKLRGKRLGYIINFHVPLMKDGIKRMIL